MTYTIFEVYEIATGEVVSMFESWSEANFYKNQLGRDEHDVREGKLTLDETEH
jgi:hypothetical protein